MAEMWGQNIIYHAEEEEEEKEEEEGSVLKNTKTSKQNFNSMNLFKFPCPFS